jgi:lipid A ethanolaminephosphotransferase
MAKLAWMRKAPWLTWWVAAFVLSVHNRTFFHELGQTLTDQAGQAGLPAACVASLAASLLLLCALGAQLLCLTGASRWVLPFYLLLSSALAYFTDNMGVHFDRGMVVNILETNGSEALELFQFSVVGHLLLTGLLPAFLVVWLHERGSTWLERIRGSALHASCSLLLLALLFIFFRTHFIQIAYEHKPLRYLAVPISFLGSASQVVRARFQRGEQSKAIVQAELECRDQEKARLVILVVGEAARSDHFALNGYERDTNPNLTGLDVISLPRVFGCATSTAQAVPCMFSSLQREDFTTQKAARKENTLDVLARLGVQILWRDNNSSSKGVANDHPQQDFRTPSLNPLCDLECRDEGMLQGLDDYIACLAGKNALIVLHQLGNHGPAYFKRYPASHAVFQPECQSGQLADCSDLELVNAYDNAIRYTDHFLAKAIALLKGWENQYQVSLIYVGDHGESLGEKGIYLHGMPWSFAPECQKRIPVIFWFGKGMESHAAAAREWLDREIRFNFLFHTLLPLFQVHGDVCLPEFDLLGEPSHGIARTI